MNSGRSLWLQLKVSTYNNEPLSAEDQEKTVKVSVVEQRNSPWSWIQAEMFHLQANSSAGPEKPPAAETEFPVPADGLIPVHIQLRADTHTLTVDVSHCLTWCEGSKVICLKVILSLAGFL